MTAARRAGRAAMLISALASWGCSAAPRRFAATDPASPLRIEQAIPLPRVAGRIDHLAADTANKRLFAAAVANGSVETIDIQQGKVVARVTGLREPQGIAWLPDSREVVVACGDGSVHFYAAPPGVEGSLRETATISLGDDADNVRVDPRNGHVVVGYGSGGLATIDPATHRLLSRTTFKGHPEGFRLSGGLAFVNVPDDGAILRLDLDHGRQLARWPTGLHRLNFPLTIDPQGKWIVIGYRLPAALARIDAETGATLSIRPTCGDTDDLYLAGVRMLVVCGAGHVDVVRGERTEARVTTGPGARTGLYVPELEALFVAVPAREGGLAEVWKLRLTTAP